MRNPISVFNDGLNAPRRQAEADRKVAEAQAAADTAKQVAIDAQEQADRRARDAEDKGFARGQTQARVVNGQKAPVSKSWA